MFSFLFIFHKQKSSKPLEMKRKACEHAAHLSAYHGPVSCHGLAMVILQLKFVYYHLSDDLFVCLELDP